MMQLKIATVKYIIQKMRNSFMLCVFFIAVSFTSYSQKNELPSIRFQNGELIYMSDSLGNQIPDYSFCGYNNSDLPIPNVQVEVVVPQTEGDATSRIQKAINYVSALPLQENGFRGAILLQEGTYEVSGRFKIEASGIVFRGSGEKTILKATGHDRETLIRVVGTNNIKTKKTSNIVSAYVPVNSIQLQVETGHDFEAGESIIIHRPSTLEWIQKLKMEEFGGESDWLGWKPGERDIYWERKVKDVKGNTILLDAPITTSIDSKYGGGEVSSFSWPGRISNIGFENLTLESEFDADNLKDENHCWFAITMENIQNAWVRQVCFRHFAGSAVAVYETGSQITVEDCISVDPVSEIAGQRRNTFFTMGQRTLFLRCYAENGNHDFATGFMASGPNAFVQCESVSPNNFSGAIDSWANGILFDVVNIDGDALKFSNRGQDGQGAGWTAANSMFWQCTAGRIECYKPPTAQNYAYGAWAQFAGDGLWYEANSHISPRSLFFAQLAKRKEIKIKNYNGQLLPYSGESTTSPTIEQAKEYASQSFEPPVQLIDFIRNASVRNPINTDKGNGISVNDIHIKWAVSKAPALPVSIHNGWLVQDSEILTGYRLNVPWWRGDPRPFEAQQAAPAITRYVPGRIGNGYTDDLSQVVDLMGKNNVVAIDHNYGLWYDRRRDDHERIKRYDSESWAPFYEQPFSRSGKGEAWDRLSKYDLTKYNTWYWSRLKGFAKKAEEKGKILIHQNYFQHNILEAGAHWADSPWRPANNINNTGFPEPPPYSGDKRIYMADQFYDVSHPVRRELHRAYIYQCLNNFRGQKNVIQSISAEFTGPLHFVEFWLDVIAEWEKETGEDVLVSLSTTKDVQDSILADPVRNNIVDIIDIRYWAYRADGSLYAPPGGVNLAPRQHARKVPPGNRSFEQVYNSVFEYRSQFPEKAVIYSEGNFTQYGWAVLMAGGSLPAFNVPLPNDFLSAVSEMKPIKLDSEQKNLWILENVAEGLIIYSKSNETVRVDLKNYKGELIVRFLNPSTGILLKNQKNVFGGEIQTIKNPKSGDVIIWIGKN